jgi:hypothetical protein
MKVTLEDFEDPEGGTARSEIEFPEHWDIFIMQFLDSLVKFDDDTHLFGYVILLGEQHPKIESAVETAVYGRVSPNLPDPDGFKRMLVSKVSQVWKDHMGESTRETGAYCSMTDKERGETTLADLTVTGEF